MKKKISLCIVLIALIISLFSINGNADILSKNMNIDNNPPNPPVIDGPQSGQIGEIYRYNITVTDPDPDDYLWKLEVDFGDGIIKEDCGCGRPWSNGETIEISNSWKRQGDYEIKARVADVNNYWSEWSEPIVVTMPKQKSNFRIYGILESFFRNVPNIYNIIKNTKF